MGDRWGLPEHTRSIVLQKLRVPLLVIQILAGGSSVVTFKIPACW